MALEVKIESESGSFGSENAQKQQNVAKIYLLNLFSQADKPIEIYFKSTIISLFWIKVVLKKDTAF